ncbi:hypothetical protein [Hydrogenovibrio marinus]|uniref:Uncharacterized protein n=1 Tax=Hydrogenovibrio marinus TaxID=28885 RepID=A0A066ZQT4_HYDMR|nr:hypothetical protein [Hydrogenovibrio marinus]KDN94624.1 hypothetical protein EI16_12020 [Hydrogenovibrio marinus]
MHLVITGIQTVVIALLLWALFKQRKRHDQELLDLTDRSIVLGSLLVEYGKKLPEQDRAELERKLEALNKLPLEV